MPDFRVRGRASMAGMWVLLVGCGTSGGADSMAVRGEVQGLSLEQVPGYRVAVAWSTERTEHEGIRVQVTDIVSSGSATLDFELLVQAPPSEVLDFESDGDYAYTSADFLLIDDPSLTDGWVDAEALWASVRGRSASIAYFVDSDIPRDALGHFGIGPVEQGFHLLMRQPDEEIESDDGSVSGTIAVWEEAQPETPVLIELGANGDALPPFETVP